MALTLWCAVKWKNDGPLPLAGLVRQSQGRIPREPSLPRSTWSFICQCDLGPSRSHGQAQSQCVIELRWHLRLGEVAKYKVYNDVQMELRLEQNCHPSVVLGGKVKTESWPSTMPRCDLYTKKWSRRSRVQDSKHQLSNRLAAMKVTMILKTFTQGFIIHKTFSYVLSQGTA